MGRLKGQNQLYRGRWEDERISVSTNKHAMTISLMSGIPLNWVKSHYFAIRCKFEKTKQNKKPWRREVKTKVEMT